MKIPKTRAFLKTIYIAAAVCLSAGFVSAQSFRVTDLGTPDLTNDPSAYSLAHGINNSGVVAGEWAPNQGSLRGFVFESGTNADIGLLAGSQYAIAYAVNSSNLVVGEAQSVVGDTRAFLYNNGMMVDLTPTLLPPVAFPYAIAHAINAAGKIAGESYVNSTEIHAVIFLGNHSHTDLGTLTNGNYSVAYGINNSNVIVGESTVMDGNTFAFIYSNSTMQAVGTLPGGTYSAAFAINDACQIAGEAANSAGDTHAFLFSAGAITDLGTLGGTNSSAAAINSTGKIVGYSLTTNGDQHAFFYNGSVMLDLNDFISPSICSNLVSADGINDSGQIAATGYTITGDYRAFLLTPTITLTAPAVLPGGQFRVTADGLPGEQIALEVSSNLVNWQTLRTNTLVARTLDFTDAPAPSDLSVFYRARRVP